SPDRLARAVAGSGLTGDLGRVVQVVVGYIDRSEAVLHIPQRAQGYLLTLAIEYVQPADIVGPGSAISLGLDEDFPDLAIEVEVVDVITAEVRLEHRENVGDRDIQALSLGAVELKLKLRDARRERREQGPQRGMSGTSFLIALLRLFEEPVGDQGE